MTLKSYFSEHNGITLLHYSIEEKKLFLELVCRNSNKIGPFSVEYRIEWKYLCLSLLSCFIWRRQTLRNIQSCIINTSIDVFCATRFLRTISRAETGASISSHRTQVDRPEPAFIHSVRSRASKLASVVLCMDSSTKCVLVNSPLDTGLIPLYWSNNPLN